MVDIRIEGPKMIVRVLGIHQVWALRRIIEVPLDCVTEIHARPDVRLRGIKGIRMPGTYVPGVIVAGTYLTRGLRVFWDVSRPTHAVVIDLRGAAYDRMIVEVDDPEDTVRRVRGAVHAHAA